jgi:hypothetical protein
MSEGFKKKMMPSTPYGITRAPFNMQDQQQEL